MFLTVLPTYSIIKENIVQPVMILDQNLLEEAVVVQMYFWHWIWKEHLKKRPVLLFLFWMIGHNTIIFLAKYKEHLKKHPVSF